MTSKASSNWSSQRRSASTPCWRGCVRSRSRRRDGTAHRRLFCVCRPAAADRRHGAAHPLAPREAIRIFTGAPMPVGADTVFMQEDCRVDRNAVIVPPGLERGANSRFAGEDLHKGAIMLPAGRKLTAADLALAAAEGTTRLPVRRRLRVAVFSTGDEVVEPGAARPAAAIYDANRHLLRGLLEKFGADVTDLGILRDDPAALETAIASAAADHDLVITSGGVSTGEADHVRTAIERIGRLVFWRVAIKPGRPVAMGVVPGGEHGHAAAFAGLPGNPAARSEEHTSELQSQSNLVCRLLL